MIKYDKLWETMERKGITKYRLVTDYDISKSLLYRLSHNKCVRIHTLDILCNILDCNIVDVATHYKDEADGE